MSSNLYSLVSGKHQYSKSWQAFSIFHICLFYTICLLAIETALHADDLAHGARTPFGTVVTEGDRQRIIDSEGKTIWDQLFIHDPIGVAALRKGTQWHVMKMDGSPALDGLFEDVITVNEYLPLLFLKEQGVWFPYGLSGGNPRRWKIKGQTPAESLSNLVSSEYRMLSYYSRKSRKSGGFQLMQTLDFYDASLPHLKEDQQVPLEQLKQTCRYYLEKHGWHVTAQEMLAYMPSTDQDAIEMYLTFFPETARGLGGLKWMLKASAKESELAGELMSIWEPGRYPAADVHYEVFMQVAQRYLDHLRMMSMSSDARVKAQAIATRDKTIRAIIEDSMPDDLPYLLDIVSKDYARVMLDRVWQPGTPTDSRLRHQGFVKLAVKTFNQMEIEIREAQKDKLASTKIAAIEADMKRLFQAMLKDSGDNPIGPLFASVPPTISVPELKRLSPRRKKEVHAYARQLTDAYTANIPKREDDQQRALRASAYQVRQARKAAHKAKRLEEIAKLKKAVTLPMPVYQGGPWEVLVIGQNADSNIRLVDQYGRLHTRKDAERRILSLFAPYSRNLSKDKWLSAEELRATLQMVSGDPDAVKEWRASLPASAEIEIACKITEAAAMDQFYELTAIRKEMKQVVKMEGQVRSAFSHVIEAQLAFADFYAHQQKKFQQRTPGKLSVADYPKDLGSSLINNIQLKTAVAKDPKVCTTSRISILFAPMDRAYNNLTMLESNTYANEMRKAKKTAELFKKQDEKRKKRLFDLEAELRQARWEHRQAQARYKPRFNLSNNTSSSGGYWGKSYDQKRYERGVAQSAYRRELKAAAWRRRNAHLNGGGGYKTW